MIFNTILQTIGYNTNYNKNNTIPIKQNIKDAELRQGAKYLQNKKNINQYITTHSSLMEGFSDGIRNPLDIETKRELDILTNLENKFNDTLTKYSSLANTVYQDEIRFLNKEMNKYVGKNIQLQSGDKFYVNHFGEAQQYTGDNWNNRGENCPDDIMNVNKSLQDLGLTKGNDMYHKQPCGYDGKIVKIGHVASSKVNLCRLGNAVASQSSNYSSSKFLAANTIDGNLNTFASTKKNTNSYWMVTLGQNSYINNIIVQNRRDCCQDRLSNFDVVIKDDKGNTVYSTNVKRTQEKQLTFNINNINKTGRTVTIVQLDDQYLHMAEVEVYGTFEEPGNGDVGYVTSTGLLREYPNKNTTNNTGSCPDMSPIPISKSVWDSFKKGGNMDVDTLCEVGLVDQGKKEELRKVNQELIDIANQIYAQIETSQKVISKIHSKIGDENTILDKHLSRVKKLFDKYNDTKKDEPTLNALLDDNRLMDSTNYTNYVLYAIFSIVILLAAHKIMTHK